MAAVNEGSGSALALLVEAWRATVEPTLEPAVVLPADERARAAKAMRDTVEAPTMWGESGTPGRAA